MKILMSAASKFDPASRFRIHQFVPYLRLAGHEVTVMTPVPHTFWRPDKLRPSKALYWSAVYLGRALRYLSQMRVVQAAKQHDVVFMNRPLLAGSTYTALEKRLFSQNASVVFDFDDAIHLIGNSQNKIAEIIASSAAVTPGNEYLASFARQHNPNVHVIPTVIDMSVYRSERGGREPGPVRIGWSGSDLSMGYALPVIEPILEKLANKRDFEFVIISNRPPQRRNPKLKTRYVRWTPETEVQGLELIDIGVMPLEDKPFERGKCGLKLLQYMALGIPSVSSPVGVNRDITIQGETGYSASTEEEWLDKLMTLMDDTLARQRMGAQAIVRVDESYSVHKTLPKLIDILEQTIAAPRR